MNVWLLPSTGYKIFINMWWIERDTWASFKKSRYNKILSTLALFGKFKKWSKILASVLKTCVYDVRSSKKNLGSIGGSLEEL